MKILRNIVYIQFVFLGMLTLLVACLTWVLYKNARRWSAARRHIGTASRVRRCEAAAERWADVERSLFESRRQIIDDQFRQIHDNIGKLSSAGQHRGNHISNVSTFHNNELPPPPTDEELQEILSQD